MTDPHRELVIDISILLRRLANRWPLMILGLALGAATGAATAKLFKKRFSSEAIFVPQNSAGLGRGLQALGMLSGQLGMDVEGGESPFVSHFEDFVKTQNFMAEMRKVAIEDTAFAIRLGSVYPGVLASDSAFQAAIMGMIYPTIKKGLYYLEIQSPDPGMSVELARLAYQAYDAKLKASRTESAKENLRFIEKLAVGNRMELESSSDELRRFQEKNHDASSPSLEKARQGLMLNLKLAEEKYILTMKELEAAKIRYEKQENDVVLIEKPIFQAFPIFPKRFQFMAAGGVLGLLSVSLAIAWSRWREWAAVPPRVA